VFLFGAPAGAIAGKLEVGRIAAEHLGGPVFAEFTTVIIAVALLTSISAMIMAGPRVYAKMAEDGFLPRWLGSEHPPATNAVILQLALALLMFLIPDFPDLAKYIGFTLGLGTALTVVGLMRLKLREPEEVEIPGWPWVPALFLVSVGGVTVFAIIREPLASRYGLLTIALGLLAWWLQMRISNHPVHGRKR
jgi:APA family basic amino acid/polyamine antiporter